MHIQNAQVEENYVITKTGKWKLPTTIREPTKGWWEAPGEKAHHNITIPSCTTCTNIVVSISCSTNDWTISYSEISQELQVISCIHLVLDLLQVFRLCSWECKDYQNELYPTIIIISLFAFPLFNSLLKLSHQETTLFHIFTSYNYQSDFIDHELCLEHFCARTTRTGSNLPFPPDNNLPSASHKNHYRYNKNLPARNFMAGSICRGACSNSSTLPDRQDSTLT